MKITIEHNGKVRCYENVEGFVIAGETDDTFFSGAKGSTSCDWGRISDMVIKVATRACEDGGIFDD